MSTPSPIIRLNQDDSVVIARSMLQPGAVVAKDVTATERIPAGHKVAVKPIAVGEPVRRYGQIIGFATAPIAPGQHVHVQNIGMGEFTKDYAWGVDVKPTPNFSLPATFEGIRRADGRVATRNYIGILTSVNCSAHVAGLVADVFKKNPFTGHDPLADYPNVDGVVALTHKTGCGMTQHEPLTVLRRTLGGLHRAAALQARRVIRLLRRSGLRGRRLGRRGRLGRAELQADGLVAPDLFQVVVLADGGLHDVRHGGAAVHDDPFAVFLAFHARLLEARVLHRVDHAGGQRLGLPVGSARRHDHPLEQR